MPLFRMYWRRTLRRPGSIVLWLLVPFVFMVIYQGAFGGMGDGMPKTAIVILDEDNSILSGLVESAMSQGPVADMVELGTVSSMAELDNVFAAEKASACLVVPPGFADSLLLQKPIILTLYRNPRHYIGPQIAEGVVGALVAMGNGALDLFSEPMGMIAQQVDDSVAPQAEDIGNVAESFFSIGNDAPNFTALAGINVVVREEPGALDELGDFSLATMFFPGLIMFGLLSVSLGLETKLLYDRRGGITRRFVTSPVAPWRIVIEQRCYALTFLYVVGVLSALLGGFIWDISTLGLSTVNVFVIALIIFIVGLNGTIFGLSSSMKATSAISSVVMIVLMLLGGGFFPADMTPDWFQNISRMTPTGMANIGIVRTLTGRETGISFPVMYACSAAMFGLSVIVGRRRLI